MNKTELKHIKMQILKQIQNGEFTDGTAVILTPSNKIEITTLACLQLENEFNRRKIKVRLQILQEEEEPTRKSVGCRLIGDADMIELMCKLFSMHGLKPRWEKDYAANSQGEIRRYIDLSQNIDEFRTTLTGPLTMTIAFVSAVSQLAKFTGLDAKELRSTILLEAVKTFQIADDAEMREFCIQHIGIDPEDLEDFLL